MANSSKDVFLWRLQCLKYETQSHMTNAARSILSDFFDKFPEIGISHIEDVTVSGHNFFEIFGKK